MEEEDAVLGLTLQLPSATEGADNATAGGDVFADNAEQGGGWEAFEAAMDAAKSEVENRDEDGDSSADDNDDNHHRSGARHDAGESGVSDEQLLAISRKKEAKQLGKRAYKRWKKLHKEHAGGKPKDKKKKSEKREKKEEKSKRESKKKGKSGPSKRARETDGEGGMGSDGDDNPFAMDEAEFLAATQAAAARSRRLESGVQRMQKPGGKKGLTAEQRFAKAEETAKKVVSDMRDARAKDELLLESGAAKKAPPLNRIAIKDDVQALCARQALIGPLIDAGLLAELSNWLYDLERGEPAPYELRSTALDILLNIPLEGEVDTGKGGKRGEDLTKFSGLSREELQPTDLGRAVNALRLHQQEASSNRSKCVRLLERLSQAYTGRSAAVASSASSGSGGQGVVSWKCKSDSTVRSPFDVVQTGSQSFQQAFMKPDPLDPTSYNNLLPWRPPVRSITNLSGTLGKTQRDMSAALND